MVTLTHTLLAHSELTNVRRVLVVCPLSTVLNWVNEFNMWLKHTESDVEVDVYELSRLVVFLSATFLSYVAIVARIPVSS